MCLIFCALCLQDLKALASQALPFSTDEDGSGYSGINPLASVFDLGQEPMDYWEDKVPPTHFDKVHEGRNDWLPAMWE